MSEHLFDIVSHIIPTSQIRGFSRGVQVEQTGHLCSKRLYTNGARSRARWPHTIPRPWHQLLQEVSRAGPRRPSCSPTNPPRWLDSARDILHIINSSAAQMPPLLHSIGQTCGYSSTISLSHLHPQRFACIILIKPFPGTRNRFQSYEVDRPAVDSQHHICLLARRTDT